MRIEEPLINPLPVFVRRIENVEIRRIIVFISKEDCATIDTRVDEIMKISERATPQGKIVWK